MILRCLPHQHRHQGLFTSNSWRNCMYHNKHNQPAQVSRILKDLNLFSIIKHKGIEKCKPKPQNTCSEYNIDENLAAYASNSHLNQTTVKKRTNTSLKKIDPSRDNPPKEVLKLSSKVRRNEVNIEMLPEAMYKHLFHKDPGPSIPPELVEKAREHLRKHELLDKIAEPLPEVDFPLPPLQGKNIKEHFYNIAENQAVPYRNLINLLVQSKLPLIPSTWSKHAGWTKYEEGQDPCTVAYPPEDALVFDIEECQQASQGPTLATAVSSTAWYSWVSDPLAALLAGEELSEKGTEKLRFAPQDLINMESSKLQVSLNDKKVSPKIIIGHNVSYDRARIKEQYWLQCSKTRFVDTMSLHVAVSGVTSYQKTQLASGKLTANQHKLALEDDELWKDKSSLSNLNEVHKLYCGGGDLDKSSRDIFISGTLLQVAENFNELMNYCASDVKATHEVLVKLFPLFLERFPHPVTLAGILELSVAYLPVNQSWNHYIRDANQTYEDLEAEAKFLLTKHANEACKLLHDNRYQSDPWLWDQDWSIQTLTLKKSASAQIYDWDKEDQSDPYAEKFRYLVKQKSLLPARRLHLPGYPAWFRKLCPRIDFDGEEKIEESEWSPGPELISPSMQITPKLLRLTWDGYPLHKIPKHGWGLVIPGRPEEIGDLSEGPPLKSLIKMCPQRPPEISDTYVALNNLSDNVEKNISKKDFWASKRKQNVNQAKPEWYQGSGIWCPDVKILGCWFRKLPHPEGPNKNVGNPLSRDFVTRLSEGTLRGEGAASTVLEIGNAVSYWRNNRERVESQQVVWLESKSLPSNVRRAISQEVQEDMEIGAILPQLQVCGTLTRRAVERTWLTASNADPKRVGSELRAMIRAPPGYHLVGADVDSQELWLAALLGDAAFAGLHGATAFGWRTLQGRKSDGTDLHSATAKAGGTSRQHAKVINYARIYGAGAHFAQQLLKRFCPSMTDEETKKAAMKTMLLTKGRRLYIVPKLLIDKLIEMEIFTPEYCNEKGSIKAYSSPWGELGFIGENGELYLTKRESERLRQHFKFCGLDPSSHNYQTRPIWYGGTESAMFNELENISGKDEPSTPFLHARLSRALEPQAVGVDNYLPTRVNWVVQSSAVDFLHLMLVNMRWLLGDSSKWRFVLSFHDEVRYLVPSERRYEAALALHVTNLMARAFCARQLNIHDLPRSVAFFSAVEVDKAMRKDADSECCTPSNPHGLSRGYGVPPGETLDVYAALKQAGPKFKFCSRNRNETNYREMFPGFTLYRR